MKKTTILRFIVGVNLFFLVAYALGVLPTTTAENSAPSAPGAAVTSSRNSTNTPQSIAGGKEVIDPKQVRDPKDAKEFKDLLDPVASGPNDPPDPVASGPTEAIDPGSRPNLPNTELFQRTDGDPASAERRAKRSGILLPPNRRNLDPPVVSPESRF